MRKRLFQPEVLTEARKAVSEHFLLVVGETVLPAFAKFGKGAVCARVKGLSAHCAASVRISLFSSSANSPPKLNHSSFMRRCPNLFW
jgi:hypothetical protein